MTTPVDQTLICNEYVHTTRLEITIVWIHLVFILSTLQSSLIKTINSMIIIKGIYCYFIVTTLSLHMRETNVAKTHLENNLGSHWTSHVTTAIKNDDCKVMHA